VFTCLLFGGFGARHDEPDVDPTVSRLGRLIVAQRYGTLVCISNN
jgi:hypothetical protein